MHKLFLKAPAQQDGSVKEKPALLHPLQYQSIQETAHVQLVTTVSKAPKHLRHVPRVHSATAQGQGQSVTVWTALLVSTVEATITRSLLDHVHPDIIVRKVPEPVYPSPMDFCALWATSVLEARRTQRSVTQVCGCHLGQMNISSFVKTIIGCYFNLALIYLV